MDRLALKFHETKDMAVHHEIYRLAGELIKLNEPWDLGRNYQWFHPLSRTFTTLHRLVWVNQNSPEWGLMSIVPKQL
jgi:hypothetical protein